MNQEELVPKRRFDGFSDEWKNNALEDLGSFGRTYAFSRSKEGFGKYSHVHYGDIHVNYNGFINEETKVPRLKIEGSFEILKKNDIVIADASEDYIDLGKTVVIEEIDNKKIIAGLHTFKYTPNKHLNSKFYLYYSQSSLFKKFSYMNGTGISVFGISKENMSKMQFNIPLEEEQQKIGQFFKHLDDMIALQQKKIEKTKALKSAYLAEMFPAEGERVPKRRIAGFTDKWELRKLGTTNTFFTDGNYGEAYPSVQDMAESTNGVPFLRGSDINNGYLDKSKSNFITKEKHAELTSGHIESDDIILAVRGSIGTLGYATQENIGWNINSQLAILRTDKKELLGKFLIQYFLGNRGQKKLLALNTGSALKQLPIKQLKDMSVPLPSVEEQQEIGRFFKNIDDIIGNHQQKLEKLKATKQAYLNEMFV